MSLMERPQSKLRQLNILRDETIGACTKCPLSQTRSQIVFGRGSPAADLMLVGEAPGKNEDDQGEPFVGQAGNLLDVALDQAGAGVTDGGGDPYYVANVCKCWPGPGNRKPEPEEMAACRPFLLEQIKIVNPRVIVVMGRTAAESILHTTASMRDIRGRSFDWKGRIVIPTWHPAYCLPGRNPEAKKELVADLGKAVRLAWKAARGG